METVPEPAPALTITDGETGTDGEKAFTDSKCNENIQVVDEVDRNLIDFSGSDDPSNPQNWPSRYKWGITTVISMITLTKYVVPELTAKIQLARD